MANSSPATINGCTVFRHKCGDGFPKNCTIFSPPSLIVQNFSIPENIVYYFAQHPQSPKIHNKLIQVSKWFYFRYPVISCEKLRSWCANRRIDYKRNYLFINKKYYLRPLLDIPKNLWIYGELEFTYHHNQKTFTSSLASKLFRCDIMKLNLEHQNITFDELNFLTSSYEFCDLKLALTSVTYKDCGTIVSIEKIIESIPKLKNFHYESNGEENLIDLVTSQTVKNLMAIHHFANLELFYLKLFGNESFDIETFLKWLKQNSSKMEVNLCFSDDYLNKKFISDDYKKRLLKAANKIIYSGVTDDRSIPLIYFSDMEQERVDLLHLHDKQKQIMKETQGKLIK